MRMLHVADRLSDRFALLTRGRRVGWTLARTVSRLGQLGVVSGTGLNVLDITKAGGGTLALTNTGATAIPSDVKTVVYFLAGDDTPGRVRRLCAKARRPEPADPACPPRRCRACSTPSIGWTRTATA